MLKAKYISALNTRPVVLSRNLKHKELSWRAHPADVGKLKGGSCLLKAFVA